MSDDVISGPLPDVSKMPNLQELYDLIVRNAPNFGEYQISRNLLF